MQGLEGAADALLSMVTSLKGAVVTLTDKLANTPGADPADAASLTEIAGNMEAATQALKDKVAAVTAATTPSAPPSPPPDATGGGSTPGS